MITDVDISIIKNMMRTKPVKYISSVIEKKEDEVQKIVEKLCVETGISAYTTKRSTNSRARAKKIEKEKELAREIKNAAERSNVERKKHEQRRAVPEQLFKTKKVDYREKVMVRIDRTTYIYAERGHEKQAREDYLKLYKTPLEKVTR